MGTPEESRVLDGRRIVVPSPEREVWPGEGRTRRDLLDAYLELAPVLLPHLAGRPVTVRVFPEGLGGPSFYRRSRPREAPAWMPSVEYVARTDGHRMDLIRIEDAAALVLRETARPHGWRLYPKTSGGSGLHFFGPAPRGATFEDLRAAVRSLGADLASARPELFAEPGGGSHRGDRVVVDHAQNAVARNTAAPWTVRARPGAPVSTPLTWEEVEQGGFQPGDFNLETIAGRLRQQGDPWAGLTAR